VTSDKQQRPGTNIPRGPIVQRDDGAYAIGWGEGAAGPFPSRAFAEAVQVIMEEKIIMEELAA
jgi:hypothetical protein